MNQDVAKVPVQPVRLVDLIKYQNGSVVSRTIIDERMGTVSLHHYPKLKNPEVA